MEGDGGLTQTPKLMKYTLDLIQLFKPYRPMPKENLSKMPWFENISYVIVGIPIMFNILGA